MHLIILVDDSRVVLNEIEGEEGSDYINASYILVSITKALKDCKKKIILYGCHGYREHCPSYLTL